MKEYKETIFERDIRWCINDVNACFDNEAYIGGMRQTCCIIDGLAGYYLGSQKDKNRRTQEEFIRFIKNYFTEFNRFAIGDNNVPHTLKMKPYRDATERMEEMDYYKILYTQYRCGLIHTILMKRGSAIYKGRNNPYFQRTRQHKLIINVEHFYDDFTRAILTYKDEVMSNKNGLKDKAEKRYKFLVGRNYSYFR